APSNGRDFYAIRIPNDFPFSRYFERCQNSNEQYSCNLIASYEAGACSIGTNETGKCGCPSNKTKKMGVVLSEGNSSYVGLLMLCD
ncbi:hypothetical protein ABRP72_17220, partial [Pectobacterium carotovorum]|uniref:hypothetical protein n=1 Tax=Pectobacterium carotovorum TaxID=554 RepID=UPI0032EAC993